MAFSAKTLYNGNDIGLQTYSVVRVFDYIGKVIIDFLNRQAFVNWTTKVERDLKMEIGRYLNSIKGYDKIIESFSITRLTQDKETKRIFLDIHITPFFPAKNFLLKLGGTKGDTAEEWVTPAWSVYRTWTTPWYPIKLRKNSKATMTGWTFATTIL
jgi:hypothetical protein